MVFISHKTKLVFHNPPMADIVIIGGIEEQTIFRAILHEMPFATMNVRLGEDIRIYLSIGVLIRLIKYIYAGHGLAASYFIACFHYIKPSAVVDYPHRSFVAKVAKEYSEAEYFSIANGFVVDMLEVGIVHTTYQYEMAKQAVFPLDNLHLFVFGQKDADIFSRDGLNKENTGINVHAPGSIIADYYRSTADAHKNIYDICFVSQVASWSIRDNSENLRGSRHLTRMLVEQTDVVIKHLSKYLIENGLTCAIQFRSLPADEADEREYYLSRLDKDAKVTFISRHNCFSSYATVAASRIILTLFSSLGFEAISWGKRAMFCPLEFKNVYKISSPKFKTDADMWEWIVEQPDYKLFSEKLDDLKNISDNDYISRICEAAQYLVNFEPKGRLGAHDVLRNKIFETLKNKGKLSLNYQGKNNCQSEMLG